jgi:hypothetical protein
VVGICVEAGYQTDFTIAKGITVRSGVDEIKNAFGIPDYSDSGIDYETLVYYAKEELMENSVHFYIADDGESSSITLSNFIKNEDDNTTTDNERPDYLDEYKAPIAMGNDLKSPVVKIEGDLYRLPCPVSEFLDNGWKIDGSPEDVISGGSESVYVEKNGKRIFLSVQNYAEYKTTAENCVVYNVHINADLDILFYGEVASIYVGSQANSITIGSTKAELDAVVPSDADCDEDTYSYSYYISGYTDGSDFSLFVDVDKETGMVCLISISSTIWDYNE